MYANPMELSFITMEYTSTTHGKQMIVDGNYLYVYQKDLANGVQSWECQFRRKQTCKARIKVLNGQIIDRVNEHQHAPKQYQSQNNENTGSDEEESGNDH